MMKTKNIHISNQTADFVDDRDIFGQIKNMRTSVIGKMKYKSTNAPELDVRYADLGRRSIATFVDLAMVFCIVAIFSLILFQSSDSHGGNFGYVLLIGTLMWIFYQGYFVSSVYQATPGEMMLKLKVIDLYGNRLGFLRALFRSIFVIFSIIPFGLGIWYMSSDLKRQCWHDSISGSFVIKG
jgi:uncharacterized RDD family membrane protein YckC